MKIISIATFLIIALFIKTALAEKKYDYPEAKRSDFVETLHGYKIPDPYRWLEEDYSKETRAWLKSQEQFINKYFEKSKYSDAFRKTLKDAYFNESMSIPETRAKRTFYYKKDPRSGTLSYYMRDDGKESLVVSPGEFQEGKAANFNVVAISKDGRYLVIDYRLDGADEKAVKIKDLNNNSYLPEEFPLALYNSFVFNSDSSGFFYTQRARKGARTIKFHKLGTPVEQDKIIASDIFGHLDWVNSIFVSEANELFIEVWSGWDKSIVYMIDVDKNHVKRLTPSEEYFYDIQTHQEKAFVLAIEADGLETIWSFDLDKPERKHWKKVVAGKKGFTIQNFALTRDYLLVHYLHNVQSVVTQYNLQGKEVNQLDIPQYSKVGSIGANIEGNSIYVSLEGFTRPLEILDINLESNLKQVYFKRKTGFDPEKYETVQKWFHSKDGTRVPMFISYKKGLKLDGTNATVLYGYGGFNHPILPSFSSATAAWMEQGGVFAVANIRGGGEFGKEWHHDGRLDKKQNVFDDFIAAAEYLIEQKYTQPENLGIMGGSNGGLLVATVTTQRPELFKAVVCRYPDLDMIGFYRFPNNNPPALLEYGNASIKEQFEYLVKYSPYQAVKKGVAYPAMYFVMGDKDTRVPPLQTRKMVAKLQWATASDEPIFLRYDEESGHVFNPNNPGLYIDADVERLDFLAHQLGL